MVTINAKGLIDNKDCIVCKFCPMSIGSDKCTACMASETKSEFEVSQSCLTCKYCNKKITQEPCMDCRVAGNKLLSKWEEVDG